MAQKCTSERIAEIVPQLTRNQLRFIVAVQEYPTKKEAAEAIGLEPRTVYKWPDIVDEAVELIATYTVETAGQILTQSLAKAVMVKIAGLDSDNEHLRQGVATEIIERHFGKPVQPQEIGLDVKSGDLRDTILSRLRGIAAADTAREADSQPG